MSKSTRKISIVTKKGDKGMTFLWGKGEVAKDNDRVILVGELDELSSFLGLAKSLCRHKGKKKFIESVQKDIFAISSQKAGPVLGKISTGVDIDKQRLKNMESAIDILLVKVKSDGFITPGAGRLSSIIDIARAVTRRAERSAVKLYRKKIISQDTFTYLNRLSDALFLLARSCEQK